MAGEIDYGYTYDTNTVQVGKFSVVKPSSVNYKDGFVLPAAKNDVVLGVLQDGIYPHGGSDFQKGIYTNVSQQAWPSNVTPSSPQGQKRPVRVFGRAQCIAAGACTRGDRAIIANNLGQVEDVDADSAITAGTAINVVGIFDTSCSNAGDVVYVLVNPHKEVK